MRVLVADDDPVSRRLLQSYLQKWGYDVVAAQDGAEAWRLFQGEAFPVVITDWMMPELDGVELVRRIRSGPRPGYVYTVLLTAKAQKEDLVAGMEAGADDFLTKPFDRDELRVRLRAGERVLRLEDALSGARGAADRAGAIDGLLADVSRDLAALAAEWPTGRERLDRVQAEVQRALALLHGPERPARAD